jgi:small subunit ribosomal protein S8
MQTDLISDLLTRIRNANSAGHDRLEVPANKMSANICRILKGEGFIKSFKIIIKEDETVIKIILKKDAIVGIERVSKPGLRVYSGYKDLPRVLSGLGISILTTSRGVLSSRIAVKMKLGGEVICNVW